MKKMYKIDAKSTSTRREDPLFTDDYDKVVEIATLFVVHCTVEVRITDVEDDVVVFHARRGEVLVDQL